MNYEEEGIIKNNTQLDVMEFSLSVLSNLSFALNFIKYYITLLNIFYAHFGGRPFQKIKTG